jgi:hypothetical protein
MIDPIAEQHIIANGITSKSDDFAWSLRCNHGFSVHQWLGGDNYSYICFCPPDYYGDMCQYQNQRVSLTLKLTTVDRRDVYVIVVTLIDDDDDRQEINSYDQSIYVPRTSCGKPVNIYLLYSTRPKNSSKNYSVRVDVCDVVTFWGYEVVNKY